MKQGNKNKWLKALNSPPVKLSPAQRKMLMRFDEVRDVEDRYAESSLCVKTQSGIWRQGGYSG